MRLAIALFLSALSGCERNAQDMYRQARYDRDEASPLFADGRAGRPAPVGSVPAAAGELAWTSSGRRGADVVAATDAANAAAAPPRATLAVLERGRERFAILCEPCHGATGAGDGPVVRRGFPAPPDYDAPRLREAPDRHLYDVITGGWGVMRPYGDRVTPDDRWAIVAYVRVLQWRRDAPVAALPAAMQARLAAMPERAGGP